MTITALFRQLGAPLRVPRQSWGAPPNGTVILRVWRDRIAVILERCNGDPPTTRRLTLPWSSIGASPTAKPNKRTQLDIFNDSKESEA